MTRAGDLAGTGDPAGTGHRAGDAAARLAGPAADQAVARWFAELAAARPWLVDVGQAGAVLLHPWAFRLAVLVAVVAAWRAGRRRDAAVAGAAMVAGGLVVLGVKLAVARPRPAWQDPWALESGYSFPSAHAANAALGAGLLLALAWPALRAASPGVRRLAVGAAVGVAVLAAVDRLVLGVHYLSDVTAGALLGAAVAALAARLLRSERRTQEGRGMTAGGGTRDGAP